MECDKENKTSAIRHLELFSTRELVEELKERTGVEVTIAEPHKKIKIKVSGPAIILKIFD